MLIALPLTANATVYKSGTTHTFKSGFTAGDVFLKGAILKNNLQTLVYVQINNGSNISIARGSTLELESNVTYDTTIGLVRIFTTHTYSVAFQNYDGTQLQTGTLENGLTPEYNGATPSKASDDGNDYTFAGWDNEVSPVTADTTYTATYTAKPRTYSVTLNSDGGTCDELTSYTFGTAIQLPTPEKAHHTFDGWYESSDFDGEAITEIPVNDTGNKEYFAKYTFVPYTEAGASDNEEIYPSIQGGIENDKGVLRFIWALNMNGTPTVNNFGAYIIPFSIFEAASGSLTNAVKVEYTDLKMQPTNGQTFSADIKDIPCDCFDKTIYAIPFVNDTFGSETSRYSATVNEYLD